MIRPSFLAVIGFAVAVMSIAGTLSLDGDQAATDLTLPTGGAEAGLPQSLPVDAVFGPLVDAARIGAKGQAVLIGRASPGAVISVTDGDREWGGTMADGRGEWVFVPDGPLPPAPHILKVEQVSTVGHGQSLVYIGASGDPETGAWAAALAVSQAPDGTLHVLQAGEAGAGAALAANANRVGQTVGWVEQSADGRITVGGVVTANAVVEIYLDRNLLGRMRADGRGEWQLSAVAPLPGLHHLRVERVGAGGADDAALTVPWQIVSTAELKADTVTIHREPYGWVLDRPLGGGRSSRLVALTPINP